MEAVAQEFFFEEERLPNPRFVPYRGGLDPESLKDLLDEKAEFKDGLADRIAAYLLVEGPFNVNSTSVEAWRALFSSLRDRDVPHLSTNRNSNRLGRGVPVERHAAGGVPVAGVTLPAGEPVAGFGTAAGHPTASIGTGGHGSAG